MRCVPNACLRIIIFCQASAAICSKSLDAWMKLMPSSSTPRRSRKTCENASCSSNARKPAWHDRELCFGDSCWNTHLIDVQPEIKGSAQSRTRFRNGRAFQDVSDCSSPICQANRFRVFVAAENDYGNVFQNFMMFEFGEQGEPMHSGDIQIHQHQRDRALSRLVAMQPIERLLPVCEHFGRHSREVPADHAADAKDIDPLVFNDQYFFTQSKLLDPRIAVAMTTPPRIYRARSSRSVMCQGYTGHNFVRSADNLFCIAEHPLQKCTSGPPHCIANHVDHFFASVRVQARIQ